MLDEGASVEHIASILEPIYLADKEVDSLCDLLTRQLDAARSRDERQRIQMRLGDLFSDRDPQAAISALASAVADGAEPEDIFERIRTWRLARIPIMPLKNCVQRQTWLETREPHLILRHAQNLCRGAGNRHEAAEILELARLDAPQINHLWSLCRALSSAGSWRNRSPCFRL